MAEVSEVLYSGCLFQRNRFKFWSHITSRSVWFRRGWDSLGSTVWRKVLHHAGCAKWIWPLGDVVWQRSMSTGSRRSIKLRLQLGMPLVIRNCAEASPGEQKRQRAKVVGSADVHPELAYALSVNDVLNAETELEQSSGAAEALTQSRADKL